MKNKTLEYQTFDSLGELKEYLEEREYNESVIFENPDYHEAVIGIDNNGSVVYDYELMAESLVESDGMTIEEAYDFLDFNMVRTIPYIKEGVKPTINYRVFY